MTIPTMNRRKLLQNAGLMGAGAALAACAQPITGASSAVSALAHLSPTDVAVLNFALNLEYLEAEYYLQAAFGRGLTGGDFGRAPGMVKGGRKVKFQTDAVRQYAEEIARDEEAHVKFLRSVLGSAAVSRPRINLRESFDRAAQLAKIGDSFDPFANETNFLLGAFIFEDVGVTAYAGAAPLLTSKDVLEAAAGILAVEAYHAAEIRTLLNRIGSPAIEIAQKISDLRDFADENGDSDQGIRVGGKANIVPTDANGLAFERNTDQVLNIVYLDDTLSQTPGGFFPDGLNGTIR